VRKLTGLKLKPRGKFWKEKKKFHKSRETIPSTCSGGWTELGMISIVH
jgi:hypothetical protein